MASREKRPLAPSKSKQKASDDSGLPSPQNNRKRALPTLRKQQLARDFLEAVAGGSQLSPKLEAALPSKKVLRSLRHKQKLKNASLIKVKVSKIVPITGAHDLHRRQVGVTKRLKIKKARRLAKAKLNATKVTEQRGEDDDDEDEDDEDNEASGKSSKNNLRTKKTKPTQRGTEDTDSVPSLDKDSGETLVTTNPKSSPKTTRKLKTAETPESPSRTAKTSKITGTKRNASKERETIAKQTRSLGKEVDIVGSVAKSTSNSPESKNRKKTSSVNSSVDLTIEEVVASMVSDTEHEDCQVVGGKITRSRKMLIDEKPTTDIEIKKEMIEPEDESSDNIHESQTIQLRNRSGNSFGQRSLRNGKLRQLSDSGIVADIEMKKRRWLNMDDSNATESGAELSVDNASDVNMETEYSFSESSGTDNPSNLASSKDETSLIKLESPTDFDEVMETSIEMENNNNSERIDRAGGEVGPILRSKTKAKSTEMEIKMEDGDAEEPRPLGKSLAGQLEPRKSGSLDQLRKDSLTKVTADKPPKSRRSSLNIDVKKTMSSLYGTEKPENASKSHIDLMIETIKLGIAKSIESKISRSEKSLVMNKSFDIPKIEEIVAPLSAESQKLGLEEIVEEDKPNVSKNEVATNSSDNSVPKVADTAKEIEKLVMGDIELVDTQNSESANVDVSRDEQQACEQRESSDNNEGGISRTSQKAEKNCEASSNESHSASAEKIDETETVSEQKDTKKLIVTRKSLRIKSSNESNADLDSSGKSSSSTDDSEKTKTEIVAVASQKIDDKESCSSAVETAKTDGATSEKSNESEVAIESSSSSDATTETNEKTAEKVEVKEKTADKNEANDKTAEKNESKDKTTEKSGSKEKTAEKSSSKEKIAEKSGSKEKTAEPEEVKEKTAEKNDSKDKTAEKSGSKDKTSEKSGSKDKTSDKSGSKENITEKNEAKEKSAEKNETKENTTEKSEVKDKTAEKIEVDINLSVMSEDSETLESISKEVERLVGESATTNPTKTEALVASTETLELGTVQTVEKSPETAIDKKSSEPDKIDVPKVPETTSMGGATESTSLSHDITEARSSTTNSTPDATEAALPTKVHKTNCPTDTPHTESLEKSLAKENTDRNQEAVESRAESNKTRSEKNTEEQKSNAEENRRVLRARDKLKKAETKTTESKTPETKPAESKIAETKPSQSKPVESKIAETKPSQSKPAESKIAETKPSQSKPAEIKPTQTKTAETKSADTKQSIKTAEPQETTIKVETEQNEVQETPQEYSVEERTTPDNKQNKVENSESPQATIKMEEPEQPVRTRRSREVKRRKEELTQPQNTLKSKRSRRDVRRSDQQNKEETLLDDEVATINENNRSLVDGKVLAGPESLRGFSEGGRAPVDKLQDNSESNRSKSENDIENVKSKSECSGRLSPERAESDTLKENESENVDGRSDSECKIPKTLEPSQKDSDDASTSGESSSSSTLNSMIHETPEDKARKESILRLLGLESLEKAAERLNHQKAKKEQYTGTLKTVIRVQKNKDKKRSRSPLKMVLKQGRSDGDGDSPEFYTIQKEFGASGMGDSSSGANRKFSTNHRHSCDENNEEAPPKDRQSLVIPEKSASFSIHPGRCCADVCCHCGGKFGSLDTPMHLAQMKSDERRSKILCMEKLLNEDSCICDACYRRVDRKANTSPTNVTPKPHRQLMVVKCSARECREAARNSVKRRWLQRIKARVHSQVDINWESSQHTSIPFCVDHYSKILPYLMCALCKRRLAKNNIHRLAPTETEELNQRIRRQGIPVHLVGGTFVCKHCRYFTQLQLKYKYVQNMNSGLKTFFMDYRERMLKRYDVAFFDYEEDDAMPSTSRDEPMPGTSKEKDKEKTKKKVKYGQSKGAGSSKSPDLMTNSMSEKSTPEATAKSSEGGNSETDNENRVTKAITNEVSISREVHLMDLESTVEKLKKRKALEQHVFTSETSITPEIRGSDVVEILAMDKEVTLTRLPKRPRVSSDITPVVQRLGANPSISVRTLFPGEEEMNLHANVEFANVREITPQGWEKCATMIQYDRDTKMLWQELQRPYGNQSSFLRHLILLEKYYRSGDLVLAPNASRNAINYSTSVQNRLISYEGPEKMDEPIMEPISSDFNSSRRLSGGYMMERDRLSLPGTSTSLLSAASTKTSTATATTTTAASTSSTANASHAKPSPPRVLKLNSGVSIIKKPPPSLQRLSLPSGSSTNGGIAKRKEQPGYLNKIPVTSGGKVFQLSENDYKRLQDLKRQKQLMSEQKQSSSSPGSGGNGSGSSSNTTTSTNTPANLKAVSLASHYQKAQSAAQTQFQKHLRMQQEMLNRQTRGDFEPLICDVRSLTNENTPTQNLINNLNLPKSIQVTTKPPNPIPILPKIPKSLTVIPQTVSRPVDK